MQKKNRSISKGIIEAKDKQEVYKTNQHFSPNVSKRTVGINLNTFLNSKPNGPLQKEELEMIQSDNFRNTNYNNTNFQPNQSITNLGNGTNTSNVNLSSNFQKYSKNVSNNMSKGQIFSGQTSNVTSSNITANSYLNPIPQKNVKLESIKNINTVIKKLKNPNSNNSNNISSNINISSKLIKPEIGSKPGTLVQKKIPAIPALQSSNLNNLNNNSNSNNNIVSSNSVVNLNNNSNLKKDSIPNINLKSSTFLQSQNINEISPKTSVTNINLNEYLSSKKELNNAMSIYTTSDQSKSLFKPQSPSLEAKPNNSLAISKINSQNSNLPNFDIKKTPETTKKTSIQETKDNSSSNSTIKNYKHSNSNSMNGITLQVNSQIQQSNIENPEDLHFFYVKMFQNNKEFANKFEKEE